MARVVILSMLALFVVGCRKHASASGPGYNAKREKALFQMAAPAMNNCDALATTYEGSVEVNYHVYRVDGCGARYVSLLHCTGPVCNWIEGPETRAAAELGCPAVQLARTYVNRVFTVSGCGKQASYQLDHGRLVPMQPGVAPAPNP